MRVISPAPITGGGSLTQGNVGWAAEYGRPMGQSSIAHVGAPTAAAPWQRAAAAGVGVLAKSPRASHASRFQTAADAHFPGLRRFCRSSRRCVLTRQNYT